VPLTVELADSVVNAPVDAVPLPIAPGAANVAPFRLDAFKLATLVVDAITNGAVPVDTVLVICPLAEIVVADTVPPDKLVAVPAVAAFKLATCVVLATVNGAVPVACVLVMVVKRPVVAVVAPIVMLLIEPAVVGLMVTVPDPDGLSVTALVDAELTVRIVNAPVLGVVDPMAGGLTRLSEPPSVKLPDDVTVPERVIPLIVPVPPTEVTVPPLAPLTVENTKLVPFHCRYVPVTVGAITNPVVSAAV
jgi:hypothetical protein